MSLKYIEEFRDGELAKGLVKKIRETSKRDLHLMEVCGTHTTAIFRHGIRSVLPKEITLLSGPGCPVLGSRGGRSRRGCGTQPPTRGDGRLCQRGRHMAYGDGVVTRAQSCARRRCV